MRISPTTFASDDSQATVTNGTRGTLKSTIFPDAWFSIPPGEGVEVVFDFPMDVVIFRSIYSDPGGSATTDSNGILLAAKKISMDLYDADGQFITTITAGDNGRNVDLSAYYIRRGNDLQLESQGITGVDRTIKSVRIKRSSNYPFDAIYVSGITSAIRQASFETADRTQAEYNQRIADEAALKEALTLELIDQGYSRPYLEQYSATALEALRDGKDHTNIRADATPIALGGNDADNQRVINQPSAPTSGVVPIPTSPISSGGSVNPLAGTFNSIFDPENPGLRDLQGKFAAAIQQYTDQKIAIHDSQTAQELRAIRILLQTLLGSLGK